MNYKNFCEQIYLNWRESPTNFDEFSKDFQNNYLPEPYYSIRVGNNPLFILNNNPGGSLSFQEHSLFLKTFPNASTYTDVSLWLMDKYTGNNAIIGGAAKTRVNRITQIAATLGYDGVENVETFFLHSNSFSKKMFLKKFSQNNTVNQYINTLTAYLIDKPVLIVSAISSKNSLNLLEVSNNSWIKYQAEIAGLNLKEASFYGITSKNQKITAGLIKHRNKFLVCTMGSNTIPKNTYLRLQ